MSNSITNIFFMRYINTTGAFVRPIGSPTNKKDHISLWIQLERQTLALFEFGGISSSGKFWKIILHDTFAARCHEFKVAVAGFEGQLL